MGCFAGRGQGIARHRELPFGGKSVKPIMPITDSLHTAYEQTSLIVTTNLPFEN